MTGAVIGMPRDDLYVPQIHPGIETGREQYSNPANAPRWLVGKSTRIASAVTR
jgi:hypothetical protein